jgi:hypothetical protein
MTFSGPATGGGQSPPAPHRAVIAGPPLSDQVAVDTPPIVHVIIVREFADNRPISPTNALGRYWSGKHHIACEPSAKLTN